LNIRNSILIHGFRVKLAEIILKDIGETWTI